MILSPRLIEILNVIALMFLVAIGLWTVMKVREIHLSMNSRLDQLLTTSMDEAHAAGVSQERAREAAERSSVARQEERDVSQARLEEGC